MRVYGMTHGDALVILKNKKADRKDTVKALDLLLTFADTAELYNLEKKELRRLIEFVTEQKMSWEHFNSTTKEELLIELREEYFASLEGSYKKAMDINEAEMYLRNYIESDSLAKVEKLSDAIETVLFTLARNRKDIAKLETIVKDFQIGTIKRRNARKKVE